MKNIFLSVLFYCISVSCFSQAENNNWYFGLNAGITFNTNPTSPLLNNYNQTPGFQYAYGCGSISNKVTGELLFTTDGRQTVGSDFLVTPNSNSPITAYCSGQSGLILPSLENRNQYFIFTLPSLVQSGILFSIFDTSLNNGLGDLVPNQIGLPLLNEFNSSFPVLNPTYGLTATANNTGDGYWILYANNNKFYAYLLNGNGISGPVVSNLGFTNNLDPSTYYSMIKVSPDGERVGVTVATNNAVQWNTNTQMRVYAFNNQTGVIDTNNSILFNNLNINNFEFSPNSNLIFLSSWQYLAGNNGVNTNRVIYYDFSTGNLRDEIAISGFLQRLFNFQITPTNEVFFSSSATNTSMSRIANPNDFMLATTLVTPFLNLNPNNDPQRLASRLFPQIIPKLSCIPNEVLAGNNIVNDYSYQVSNTITTNGNYVVNGNQSINLFAGNTIVLEANTHFTSNSSILAKIQPCPINQSKSVQMTRESKSTQQDLQLILFPNPTDNQVALKLSEGEFNSIKITSMEGKLIFSTEKPHMQEYLLELATFSKGVYLLSVETETGQIMTKKLVKN